jgi:hypothetical protein
MSRHLSYFMRLDCAGDVLNSIDPMRKPLRRITEAVAVTKKIRPAALANPGMIKVLQITDGNGVEAIVASHLLKLKSATVITSKMPKNGLHKRVENFTLKVSNDPFTDINDETIDDNTVLVFTGNIDYTKAKNLYMESDACGVIMMPNTSTIRYYGPHRGTINIVDDQAAKLIALMNNIGGLSKITVDLEILGQNNIIISDMAIL